LVFPTDSLNISYFSHSLWCCRSRRTPAIRLWYQHNTSRVSDQLTDVAVEVRPNSLLPLPCVLLDEHGRVDTASSFDDVHLAYQGGVVFPKRTRATQTCSRILSDAVWQLQPEVVQTVR